jgi:hypothetical protein
VPLIEQKITVFAAVGAFCRIQIQCIQRLCHDIRVGIKLPDQPEIAVNVLRIENFLLEICAGLLVAVGLCEDVYLRSLDCWRADSHKEEQENENAHLSTSSVQVGYRQSRRNETERSLVATAHFPVAIS